MTGCDYLPVLRRVAVCTERSMAVWDNRAKGKNQVMSSTYIQLFAQHYYQQNVLIYDGPQGTFPRKFPT